MTETVFALTGAPNLSDRAISPFTPFLLTSAKQISAELYIAHYPAALPAAALVARRHNARYAYDAEDFHLGDWPDGPEYEPQRRLVRAVEGRHLPGCAFVTAASQGIADALVEAYGIPRPTVLHNVFGRADTGSPTDPVDAGMPGPSIYWFSQTIGPDRGLEVAVEAIGLARTRPHLYLRGHLAQGFLDHLEGIASRNDVSDRLHLLPSAPPPDMVRLARAYDVGLSSETGHTQNRRIALNNKLFTYLLAGIPLLLSDIPAHRAFAAEAGSATYLYSVENAKALAAAIDAVLGNPQKLATARSAAFQLGQTRFNWDIEKMPLLDHIAALSRLPNGTTLPGPLAAQ